MSDKTCPNCQSENVIFNEKKQIYVCEDCKKEILSGDISAEVNKRMNIFLSYGHDGNAALVERIRADLEGRGHDVWIDREEIKFGDDWRRAITDGIIGSDWVLSFLSKHSAREPGVCLDELAIALGVKGGVVHTVLVESEQEVTPPVSVSHIQWLDMHEWKTHWDDAVAAPRADGWYEVKFAEIAGVIESDANRQFAGEIEILKNKLKPLSPDARIGELLGQGFVGRQWLVQDIDRWLKENQESRVFLLTGEPGVGKSAFAAWLAHHNKANIIAAHFIEYNKPDRRDPKRIVTSLSFQIATRLPDYRKLLMGLPELDSLGEKNAAELFSYLIAEPLQKAIAGGRTRYAIFMDAIDEASDDGSNSLVDLLAQESRKLPDWITFIITSRPYPAILRRLSHLAPLELNTDDARNREDLAGFIRKWLTVGNIKADVEDVTHAIVEASEGNFLYLRQFCEGVENGWIDVEDAQAYPKGMTGMYEGYFKRQMPVIDAYERNQVPLLELIVAGYEPIPEELAEKILEWKGRDRIRVLEPLASLFLRRGGLIAPFHKSVKDWLTDYDRSGKFFISIEKGHHQWAEFCLSEYRADVFSMSAYALKHIVKHLMKTNQPDKVAEILTDVNFAKAKYLAGLKYELINDYMDAVSAMTSGKGISLRSRIMDFLFHLVSEEEKTVHETKENIDLPHVHIALDIVLALADQGGLHEIVEKIILAACWHKDVNTRSLGVIAVHRLARRNYDLGMAIIRKLAAETLLWRFPRLSKIEPYVGCALGLYLENVGDEKITSDLHQICRHQLDRLLGWRLAAWLAPPIVSNFFKAVPDDYNPLNWAEITILKQRMEHKADLPGICRQLIDHIDPAVGMDRNFSSLIQKMQATFDDADWDNAVTALQSAFIARILAGNKDILSLTYDLWRTLRSSGHIMSQDFMFQMRIVQLGLELKGEAPLNELWTRRVEEGIRYFFYDKGACFKATHEYIGGSLMAAFPFLVRQPSKSGYGVLKEFIDHACTSTHDDAKDRKKRLDAIMMRVVEVTGLEYGCYDVLSRGLSFYGLECFLNHHEVFDEYMWNRYGEVLARMRNYFSEEVRIFLAKLTPSLYHEITERMSRIVVKENIGTLISMKHESLYASLLSEPPGFKSGIRPLWQESLGYLYSKDNMTSTLRNLVLTLFRTITK